MKLNSEQTAICDSMSTMLELRGIGSKDANHQLLQLQKQLSEIRDSLHSMSVTDNKGLWCSDLRHEPLRLQLQHECMHLQKMLMTPHDVLQGLAQAHHVEAALRYACYNQLAHFVPAAGTVSFEALATQASVDSVQCKRLVRMLISHHVFSEPSIGFICHNPASRMLLNPDVDAWVQYQTTDSLKSSTCLPEALQKWPSSKKPTETAFSLAHATKLPMFEFFRNVPGKLDRFRRAMAGIAQNSGFDVQHAVRGYKWQQLDQASRVIDVGGGRGHVATAILEKFPTIRMTVQDIGVREHQTLEGIDLVKHDFFEPQPIKAAQAYFMRQVLHDWPDEEAVKILRNQIAAMNRQSKLIIMEIVMPRPEELTILEERRLRTTDITMLTLFSSGERDLSQWLDLMRRADARLCLKQCDRPAGSSLSVMEWSFSDQET